MTCTSCNANYVSTKSRCPYCGASSSIRRSEDEFTTKIVDDNDLMKGG